MPAQFTRSFYMINEASVAEMYAKGYRSRPRSRLYCKLIVDGSVVHMAKNGCLLLHATHQRRCDSSIPRYLRTMFLKDWYQLFPERFQNKTNGITPRRWIAPMQQGAYHRSYHRDRSVIIRLGRLTLHRLTTS